MVEEISHIDTTCVKVTGAQNIGQGHQVKVPAESVHLVEALCKVYSTRRFVVYLSVCHFVLVFFSPFSIGITLLGEERANLSAFRTFVRLCLLRFVVSSSSWGLGRDAVCDCGTPWTFLLPFLVVVCLIVEKIWNVNVNCVKVNGAQNIGQGHWVNVPAKSGGQGDVSCKV